METSKTMSRGAQPFTQRSVTTAVKGVVQAGVKVARVEIADGKITVFAGEPEVAVPQNDDVNEWDSVK